MFFDVRYLMEQGWVLPRFRSRMLRPILGDLVIQEDHDDLLRRHVRIARLLDPATKEVLTIPRSIYDVTVIAANGDSLTRARFWTPLFGPTVNGRSWTPIFRRRVHRLSKGDCTLASQASSSHKEALA